MLCLNSMSLIWPNQSNSWWNQVASPNLKFKTQRVWIQYCKNYLIQLQKSCSSNKLIIQLFQQSTAHKVWVVQDAGLRFVMPMGSANVERTQCSANTVGISIMKVLSSAKSVVLQGMQYLTLFSNVAKAVQLTKLKQKTWGRLQKNLLKQTCRKRSRSIKP